MEREIFCDECGHCAIEVDSQAAGTDLDGIHCVCQGCNVDGKIIYLDDGDEGGPYSWLKFRKLTEDEESELASLVRDGRDEVEIEVDRMFEATDVSELAVLLIRDGWLDKWMSGPRPGQVWSQEKLPAELARIGDGERRAVGGAKGAP